MEGNRNRHFDRSWLNSIPWFLFFVFCKSNDFVVCNNLYCFTVSICRFCYFYVYFFILNYVDRLSFIDDTVQKWREKGKSFSFFYMHTSSLIKKFVHPTILGDLLSRVHSKYLKPVYTLNFCQIYMKKFPDSLMNSKNQFSK